MLLVAAPEVREQGLSAEASHVGHVAGCQETQDQRRVRVYGSCAYRNRVSGAASQRGAAVARICERHFSATAGSGAHGVCEGQK